MKPIIILEWVKEGKQWKVKSKQIIYKTTTESWFCGEYIKANHVQIERYWKLYRPFHGRSSKVSDMYFKIIYKNT
jgi:hypothetical protein